MSNILTGQTLLFMLIFMEKMDFAKLVRFFVLLGLMVACQEHKKERVGKTDSRPLPKKVYPFDSAQGCYRDAIVNGNIVSDLNPLKRHIVMIISLFRKSANDPEVLSNLCTGTLIGPNTILTAAHCFPKNLISSQVFASINLFCSSGFNKQLVYQIQKIDIHPDYKFKNSPNDSSPDFDIATVQFEGVLPADYLPLPLKKIDIHQEKNNPTSHLIMVGYGRTQTEIDSLPELRYVTKSWDRLLLESQSQNLIDRLNLIGIDQADSRGGCRGDSGGPLLISENGAYKIVGVASYLVGRSESQLCEQGQIFYSYVPAYWDWILQQLQ